jgi:hypothetical protein
MSSPSSSALPASEPSSASTPPSASLTSVPPDVLHHFVAAFLDPPSLLNLSHTCADLLHTFSPADDDALWRRLAALHDVPLPPGAGATTSSSPTRTAAAPQPRRLSRSTASLRRTFFTRWRQRDSLRRAQVQAALLAVYEAMCTARRAGRDLHRAALVHALGQPFPVDTACDALDHNTAVNLAARCGCRSAIVYLVEERGADLSLPDVGGFTPLHNAAWRGDEPIVAFLVGRLTEAESLVRPGWSKGEGPFTPAEWARRRGHEGCARRIEGRLLEMRGGEGEGEGQSAGAGASSKRRRTRAREEEGAT